MTVEQRGDEWCVIHCTGPDKGKAIKCFPTEKEADDMHDAIMAHKTEEFGKADKPPKAWWDSCVARAGRIEGVVDPDAFCGWMWHHGSEAGFGAQRGAFGKAAGEFDYTLEFQKIADTGDDLIIAGYASSESLDVHGQIMDMGSMRKAWGSFMKNPVVRFMHGMDKIPGAIGRVIPEYTDSSGKVHRTNFDSGQPYVVAKISNSPDLDDIRVKIKEGLYTGLSVQGIAYKAVEYSKQLGRMVERLFVKSLQEISVVDIPANQDSLFNVLKAACIGDSCGIEVGNDDRNDLIPTDIIIRGDGNMGEFSKEEMASMIKDTIRSMTTEDQLIQKAAAHDGLVAENAQLTASLQTATSDLATLKSEFETFKKSAGGEGAGAEDAAAMKTELADLKGKLETLSSAPFFKAQLGQDEQGASGKQTPPADIRGAHLGAIIKANFGA